MREVGLVRGVEGLLSSLSIGHDNAAMHPLQFKEDCDKRILFKRFESGETKTDILRAKLRLPVPS